MRVGLPLDRLAEDVAVGGVIGGEGVAAILHAEHHKGSCAVVAHAAASVGSHANYGAFLNGEDLAVNLKFARPGEKEV